MGMIISLLLLCFSPLAAFGADMGIVNLVIGQASVSNVPLHKGDKVRVGETIDTGAKSLVRVVLTEGVAFQVGPQSSIRLEHVQGQPTTVNLLKGYVLSHVKKLSTPPKQARFRVLTKSAALGVRGTTFFAKLEKDGRTFLCVCEGTVNVTWNKGVKLITSKHHDNPIWIVPGAKIPPVAPMGWEHNDKEAGELAKLIP
jgi:hypothetical protein